ncbi:hypothetical protein Y1Q_0015693 [Alligator mississippiensis]|uniref:Myb/SANT-like DNA-binding domain-containing protein n=1 Tax=Alligator mississippiensis TaxID=8496 RepID=A0A151NNR0_ALLMI|nr:hypothetical protein Y1Q_0015693 [Alligator mississippiensis]
MAQEADTSNVCEPNWTWEELEDLINICLEQRIIDRLESRRNKPVYVEIAKGMQVRGHNHDWTQLQCKIKSLRSVFYRAKDASSHSGATSALFYDKLSIILSKDVGATWLEGNTQMPGGMNSTAGLSSGVQWSFECYLMLASSTCNSKEDMVMCYTPPLFLDPILLLATG